MDFSGDYFIKRAEQLHRSEAYIKALQLYIDNLQKKKLPIILSPQHWALKMGMQYEELSMILENRELYYNHYRIRKKRGGFRAIQAPQGKLFQIQLWLKTFVLDMVEFPSYLTSYQKRKSIIDNAALHVGKEIVVKFDLANFFESITQEKVFGLFKFLGYDIALAIDMAKACCVNIVPKNELLQSNPNFACLPQGAPSSPALSNIAGFKLDLRLSAYAKSKNLDYSRYADDLTFSGNVDNKVRKSVIMTVADEEGFHLNLQKVNYIHRSNKQIVTGITVNEKLSLSKKYRKSIHTHLHYSVKFGPYNHLTKNGVNHTNYREWLLGNIFFIKQLHPNEAERMMKKFELIMWI